MSLFLRKNDQLVSWYFEPSQPQDYITAKNNVQSVSYLLCTEVINPQIQLKLNDDKTASVLIKSDRTMLPDSAPTSIQVGNSDIPFVTHARNLEITILSNTTMDKHVTNICRSAYAELRRISSTCHLLTVNATKTPLSAFVLSKLDYCNSLLCGSPQFILDKLQRGQHSAARLVMKSQKCDHVQPLLRSLHWLPVHSGIDHRISTLCFNTFTKSFPVYIAQLLSVYTPSRHPRSSSDTRTLRIPFVKN